MEGLECFIQHLRDHGVKEELTALHVLVLSKASLLAIQEVYEMNPCDLTEEVFRDACNYGAQKGVLPFLAENFSGGDSGNPLLHFLMGSGPGPSMPSLEDLESLLNINPEWLLQDDGYLGGDWLLSPLELSVLRNYDMEVVRLLAAKIPPEKDAELVLPSNVPEDFGDVDGYAFTERLSLLLPRTKQLDFDCTLVNWTDHSFSMFLSSLIEIDTPRTLCLEIPEQFATSGVFEMLRKLASSGRTISKLQLSVASNVRVGSHNDCSALFQNFYAPTVRNFCVEYFVMRDDRSLLDFLGSYSAPVEVHLKCLKFYCPFGRGNSLRASGITDLCVGLTRASQDWYHGLFDELANMPKLRTCKILLPSYRVKHDDKLSQSLAKLLKHGKLEEFSVDEGSMSDEEIRPLLSALKYNTTLRRFDVFARDSHYDSKSSDYLNEILRDDNATLTDAAISDNRFVGGQYFLDLNRFGRAVARNPSTCKATIIKLLAPVNRMDKGELHSLRGFRCVTLHGKAGVNENEDDHWKLSILYGLLREMPSVWCAPPLSMSPSMNSQECVNRKRKFCPSIGSS